MVVGLHREAIILIALSQHSKVFIIFFMAMSKVCQSLWLMGLHQLQPILDASASVRIKPLAVGEGLSQQPVQSVALCMHRSTHCHEIHKIFLIYCACDAGVNGLQRLLPCTLTIFSHKTSLSYSRLPCSTFVMFLLSFSLLLSNYIFLYLSSFPCSHPKFPLLYIYI